MNDKEILNRGHNKPKSGLILSSTYKLDTGMHRQVSPSGGRMGGVLGLPPSNTMTWSSISWINNLCWLHRMATSQSTRCCLLNFFIAQWLRQWQAMLDICCWECVCVCVCLTSSRGGLPFDAVSTARWIHPPQCLQRHTPSKLRTSASPWGDVSWWVSVG